ncbi:MAG: Nif3-like dinuclear metal center hexameric protein [Promethearchaeota archaeon]
MEKEFVLNINTFCKHFQGIQFGFELDNRIIKKALITIAPTLDSLKEAYKEKINLILSYYPLYEHPTLSLREDISQRLALLSSNRTILYVLNSAFNSVENGFIDILINKLQLVKEGVFQIEDQNYRKIPIGRICSLQSIRKQKTPLTLFDLLTRIGNFLSTECHRYIGNLKQKVKKICIIEQISEEIISIIKKYGCQCCITRDINYKEALFARDLDISLIEIAHYPEITVFNELCNLLSLEFPYVEFSFYDFETPFSYFHNKINDKRR